MLAEATYGAELSEHTKQEMADVATAACASERMALAGVPNYIKETVLGAKGCPRFRVAAGAIKAHLDTSRQTQARCALRRCPNSNKKRAG
jgi:hypothetical protein